MCVWCVCVCMYVCECVYVCVYVCVCMYSRGQNKVPTAERLFRVILNKSRGNSAEKAASKSP